MAAIPGLLPVVNSVNNAGSESARKSGDSSKGLSSVTPDEVAVTPVVALPPPPEAIDKEDEDEDGAEPNSKFKGTCVAIPYILSTDDGVTIPTGAGAAVLVQEDHLWDNGANITYNFMPRVSKLHEWGEDKVHDTVKEWSKYANITFEYKPDAKNALVRIAFDRTDGSWSFTGKKLIEERPTNEPTMNLGGVEKIIKVQETDTGTILHEFGHVLGLKHELQSPLREDVFKINEPATIEAYQAKGWSLECIKDQVLDAYNNQNVGNYTDLDLTSVMMYFMPAAQNDKGLEIEPNNKLSDYDKAFMLVNYPYFGFEERVPGWDFAKALDVFGIQGEDRADMMDLYGAGNVRDVRRHFATVIESVRAQRNAALARDVAARAPAPV